MHWKCLVRPGEKGRLGATTRIDNEVRTSRKFALTASASSFSKKKSISMRAVICLYRLTSGGKATTKMKRDIRQCLRTRPVRLRLQPRDFISRLRMLGEIPHVFVTLHVGVGTFRPVQAENMADHRMHAERFAISDAKPRERSIRRSALSLSERHRARARIRAA